MSNKFFFECVTCGRIIDPEATEYLCPDCRGKEEFGKPPLGVLKTLYNYKVIRSKYKGKVFSHLKKTNYLDLLPIKELTSLSYLKIGKTPLYRIDQIKVGKKNFELYLKDDSQNPTFSYKDRASNLVSALAREKDINTIITASTGNAGSSLAGICASQGQKALIFTPSNAPKAKLTQILMYGALLIPVSGTYDDAFDLSIKATEEFGWYNRNTAFNPFTIEGKKTAAFEIFDQLDESIPDRIFVPVGDGVIISGIYKGFEDLLSLNIIEKIPEIVAVQSSGSNNLIGNLNNTKFVSRKSNTIADSISVDIPRNFEMAKKFILSYAGKGIEVTDQEILSASEMLSKNTGIFAEPAAAAAYAGFLKYNSKNMIRPGTKNVVLLTGSGLKDLDSVQPVLKIPNAVEPDIVALRKLSLLNKLIAG